MSLCESEFIKSLRVVTVTSPESEPGNWSESDFIYVLSLSFPEPSNQLLLEAGPLLYRLIFRLGSYPYHQEKSAKDLDLGTLQKTVTILLQYDEYLLQASNSDEERDDHAARLQDRYLRLLSQSLAATPNLDIKERGEDDYEDVTEALHIASRRRILRHPTNPRIGTLAAALPPPSSFPPSYSRTLEGRLANADLHILIRLVLAYQLYWSGTGPEYIVASPSDGFNKAANSILSSFDPDEDGRYGWQSFYQAMAQQKSSLQIAMPRILTSLTESPPTVNKDALFSLPPVRAAELLSSAYTSIEPSLPTLGAILTLPLLCQLSMFLPEDLSMGKAKLVYSSRSNENTTQKPKTHFESPSAASALLLLVSGKPHHSTTEPITCGAYLPAKTLIPSSKPQHNGHSCSNARRTSTSGPAQSTATRYGRPACLLGANLSPPPTTTSLPCGCWRRPSRGRDGGSISVSSSASIISVVRVGLHVWWTTEKWMYASFGLRSSRFLILWRFEGSIGHRNGVRTATLGS